MTKQSASTDKLEKLHNKVADVLTGALDAYDLQLTAYNTAGSGDEPPPVLSAPLLGVVTKFLSDNSITANDENREEISELKARLEQKRHAKRAVGNIVAFPSQE